MYGWSPLLIPLMVHESHGGVAGGVRGGDMSNPPDNPSSTRRREKLSLKCDTWSTSNLVSSGGVGCQLSTRDVSGRLPTSKNLVAVRGRCPLGTPTLKRGAPPLLITPRSCVLAAALRKNQSLFGEGPNKAQNDEVEGHFTACKGQRSK